MKRYLVMLAALVMLAMSLGAGAAGAATSRAATAPSPDCPWTGGCTCPPGWQVKWQPIWEFWGDPTCVRK